MKQILHTLSKIEEMTLGILLILIILLACAQIVLRSCFSTGFLWIDPLIRQLVLWAGLLGAVLATGKGQHISLDIVSYLAPEKIRNWLNCLINLFSAIVCTFLTWASCLFLRDEYLYGGPGLFSISGWVWSLIFPVAFICMSLRFFYTAAISTRDCFSSLHKTTP